MGAHSGDSDTGEYKSLEEVVLEGIDVAAAMAEVPAKQAFDAVAQVKKISIALLFFVLVFAGTTTYSLLQIHKIADDNQQYLIDGCESGNKSRASELGFWLSLFETTANDPESKTKVAIERRKLYLDKLYKTYPQVDCSKVKIGKRVELPTVKVEKPVTK